MTEETIYQEMLETFREKTGYEMNGEADLAVRLRAAATQIMSLYHYGDYIYRQAFPQTATGEGLERHGALRGVIRDRAEKATGTLTFRMLAAQSVDRSVPAGTVCFTGQLVQFVTTEAGVIPAGETEVTVAAEAAETGSAGNVLPESVVRMQTMPAGIQQVTNHEAFTGGRNRETDEHYRERIVDVYQGVSNGVNEAFYKQLARSVAGVDRVEVIPKINGVGSVGVIIDSDSGVVTDKMIYDTRQLLGKYREVCLELRVYKPETLPVDISLQIIPAAGYALGIARSAVAQAVTEYVWGLHSGETLYRSGLVFRAMETGCIANVLVVSPTSDVSAQQLQRIRIGTFTVEAM